jgi:hypothetical protein
MTSDEGRKPEGTPERSPKAGVGAPSGVDGNGPVKRHPELTPRRHEELTPHVASVRM